MLMQVNSGYVWTCAETGKVIIEVPALNLGAKDYEKKATQRLNATQKAIEKHYNGHRNSRKS